MADKIHSGEDYVNLFNTRAYLYNYYHNPTDKNAVITDFRKTMARQWHDAVGEESDGVHGDLLDLGTGASITSVISASKYCDSITVTDYCPDNRRFLQQWIDSDKDAFDWTPYLNNVASLEGNTTASDIEERIRAKLQLPILTCDVLQEMPVPAAAAKKFDVITTQTCLVCACVSHAQYEQAVHNLTNLLKPGGKVFVAGLIRETFYTVGNEKFFTLPITPDFAKCCFQNAGFADIKLRVHQDDDEENEQESGAVVADAHGLFLLSAIKL